MSTVNLNMMDVLVRSAPIGDAAVHIAMGATSGGLRLDVQHRTDRYRRIRVQWRNPRTDEWVWLANAVLDTATGELLPPDFDTSGEAARRRPRS